MQRLTRFALTLAVAGLLAAPAAAADDGWQPASGVSGTYTVLRTADGLAIAGGYGGAIETGSWGEVVAPGADDRPTWAAATPPTDAAIRDVAGAMAQTLFAVDARGMLWRSGDSGQTWTQLQPGGVHPVAIAAVAGARIVVVARRSLLWSGDAGDTFALVTPKLARSDAFTGTDMANGDPFVFGPRSVLVSGDLGRHWQHLRLPPLARGDSLLDADFATRETGFVLSSFRRLYRTRDAGHHWTELLGAGGAGADLAFEDSQHGYLSAPGFANRFDGYVLYTDDGGQTWRPQPVAPGFVSAVAITRSAAFAIGNDGSGLFATRIGAERGTRITIGFRPSPRVAHRGERVKIRGRVAPAIGGVGVAVSMRSAGRWIVRWVHTNANGVFTAKFAVQRRAWFVAQAPATAGHGSAATTPVLVRVKR